MATFIGGRPSRVQTCKVTFQNWDKTVECPAHTNLRQLAVQHDIPLYNGLARFTNCQGFGLCGTCAVEVQPMSNVTTKGARENLRFFQLHGNLRLACQVEVVGDITVMKHGGMYGSKGYDSELPKDEVVRLYREEGKTIAEIAEHLGTTPSRVLVALELAGVELRKPGSAA